MEVVVSSYARGVVQEYFEYISKEFKIQPDDLIKMYARTIEIYKGEHKKPIQRTKISNPEDEEREVIKKLCSQESRRVTKNKYGNFSDCDDLVWSEVSMKVIGRQIGDTVRRLTQEDIELCKANFIEFDTRMIE
jgi:hypothetical protein